ncbi:hypothetical protein R1sor_014623 [Riccia sorocarpa]|uniref:Fe2OG dioxygenase domain-containing protein n=1 Tax=Riccia sorocarpa TaxID=122646 RepID=A0ABD3HDS9_9MARC
MTIPEPPDSSTVTTENPDSYEKSKTAVSQQPVQLGVEQVDEIPEKWKVSPENRAVTSAFEFIDVPAIDLSLMETDRAELARKLRDAATRGHFCRIVNHDVPLELMKEIEIQGKKFFGQSIEVKSELVGRGDAVAYYTGNNTTEWRHSLHWAESFAMLLGPWNTVDLDVVKKCTAIWVTADDEFRKAFLKYLICLKSTTEKILQLFAEGLGLKSDFYSSVLEAGIAARWNYYPVCPEPDEVLGAHSHTDPQFLTFIQQDQVDGLQVQLDGQWYNVETVGGTLLMSISDLFQIWTNGLFKSVLHRVLVNRDVPRFSIAWVISVVHKQDLAPPEELIDEKHPRVYRDLTAMEYFQTMMTSRLEKATDPRVFNGQTIIDNFRI